MSVVSTTVEIGVTQADGRAWIREIHTLSDGRIISGSYKGDPTDALARAEAKAPAIAEMMAQAEAEQIING